MVSPPSHPRLCSFNPVVALNPDCVSELPGHLIHLDREVLIPGLHLQLPVSNLQCWCQESALPKLANHSEELSGFRTTGLNQVPPKPTPHP